MKVSLNTIKQLVGSDLPSVDELVARINAQLGGVEDVIDLDSKYKDAKIVRVVECEKHDNADKLSVCKIDAGTGELVQVVCGAPNVRADMWAVWLPPESIVPSSYDDAEPFKLSAREIRGVLSNGMLASGQELAINSDHDGIVELSESDLPPNGSLIAGASFAQTFMLDDVIIDIENKMFTHRPDCFGQLGVAREIHAILQPEPDQKEATDNRYQNPDWYWNRAEFQQSSNLELSVFNEAEDKVPRFMAVALDNVTVGPSPLWLQVELIRWGSKSINNVVDLTNWIMLFTAQPTHAYDYDKLRGHKIGARMAQNGEKVTLLNGKTYELNSSDVVIADGEGAIGLGGIMGGSDSEVSAETKNVVLEVANFDMYTLRKTAMHYGLFTDAVTRFNKGQSPLQNDRITARLMYMMNQLAGAEQASDVYDISTVDTQQDSVHGALTITPSFIADRLGIDMTAEQIATILRSANFAVFTDSSGEGALSITAPFWRTDIIDPEDIVEEVGRLYGFDNLPRELPRRSIKPAPSNSLVRLKSELREGMARAGANEVLTYSFVHEKALTNSGQNPEKAFRLSNALSPELQYYRLSMVPSLLEKVHMNIKAGHDEFTLFELGKAHHKDEREDGVPKEFERLAAVYSSKKPKSGAPYYRMRELVDSTALERNFSVHFSKLSDFDFGDHDTMRQMCAPFEPERSAIVMNGEAFGGVVGEFRQSVIKKFKLPEYSAACELFLSLFEKNSSDVQYRPLSRFPSVTQDISLKVSTDTTYQALFAVADEAARAEVPDLEIIISPVTIYQSETNESSKTITLRIKATSHERTLQEMDVTHICDAVEKLAGQKLNATRV